MYKCKSYLAYSITILGSVLVAIMTIIDAVYFPLETDNEPLYYYIILLCCGLLTLGGIILSKYWRNRFSTSKKEEILSYSSFVIGFVLIFLLFINDEKYLIYGSVGFGLLVIGLSSLLSTEIGLNIQVPVNNQKNLIYLAFPKEIKKDVKATIKWLKRKHQLKKKIIKGISSVYYKMFNIVAIPLRVMFDNINPDKSLNDVSIMIYWCLQTRNSNGRIREEYLKKLIENDYPLWCIPYIIELSTDYVLNIVNTIYEGMKVKPNIMINEYYNNDLKMLRHGYSIMLSYWNAYYREKYPNYKTYPGYKLFTECYGFKKKYYKKTNIATMMSLKTNKMWELYGKGELEEIPFMLCNYYSGVLGEGHSVFFKNISDYRSDYKPQDYVEKLKGIIPSDLYENLLQAFYSFETKTETKRCSKSDNYFYNHEEEYCEVLNRYANGMH